MTPKEKAQELVCKMYGCEINTDLDDIYHLNGDGYFIAISAATKAVDEILIYCKGEHFRYFEQVKQEISKI